MDLASQFAAVPAGTAVIDTVLGPLGLAWTAHGLDRIVLSDPAAPDADALAAELRDTAPGRPTPARLPRPVAAVARRLKAHLGGRLDPLDDIPVDLTGVSVFASSVLATLRTVGPGETVTYGELAARAGRPGAARAIGRIMGSNPVPLVVPCHRCLPRDTRRGPGGFSSRGGSSLKARLLFVEGVHLDPVVADGLEHLRRADPKLRRIIPRVGPYLPRLGASAPLWDTLVRSIIHQQISVAAGRTIVGRVTALTPGDGVPSADRFLTLDADTLRAAGLSRQKQRYLGDLAARVADGRLDLRALPRLDDERVVAELTTVTGIGRWSAEMVLIFHLGRLDVLPSDDLGLRNSVQRVYDLPAAPTPRELDAFGERWRPYRSLASWYLWQA